MEQPSLITDKLRADLRLGVSRGSYTFEVDKKWIRQFAKALGDDNPLWHDEEYAVREGAHGALTAPPTFFNALEPAEALFGPGGGEGGIVNLEGILAQIPYKRTMGGSVFDRVEYVQPIKAGDVITVTVTYTDVYEREGRGGRLLFIIRECRYTNQQGDLVAIAVNGNGNGYDLSQRREE